MRIAYLILAHNTPNHLKRLINALQFENDDFFIHVDRKSPLADYSTIHGSNIYFTEPRIPVYWGEFSQVRAIVNLFRHSLTTGNDYSYRVLLSGSDYPLRSADQIHRFFDRHSGSEFINMVAMPNEAVNKPISRLDQYNLQSDGMVPKKIRDILDRFLSGTGQNVRCRDHRRYLGTLVPYGGSTWWALTTAACRYILDFMENNTGVVDFFVNTLCPDEMFFQTILGNSPFRMNVRRNLTFADWASPGRKPAFIDEKHIELFEANQGVIVTDDTYGKGELLFARKFPDDSGRLVSRIDNLIALNK